jgi:hypothetical protein
MDPAFSWDYIYMCRLTLTHTCTFASVFVFVVDIHHFTIPPTHPVVLWAKSPMAFMQMKWSVENVSYFWKTHGFAPIQPDYDTPADRGVPRLSPWL